MGFIEFSSRPRLIEVKGDTFADRLRYVASFNEIANTNLEAVFDLILNAAVRNQDKQKFRTDIEPRSFQNCTEEQLAARVNALLEATKGRRYVMANSDSCPPAVEKWKFRLISELVQK